MSDLDLSAVRALLDRPLDDGESKLERAELLAQHVPALLELVSAQDEALRVLRPAAATEDWHAEYGRVLVQAFRDRDGAKSELLLRYAELGAAKAEARKRGQQLAWLGGQVQTLRGLCDGIARMDGYDPQTANVTVREIRRIIDMKPSVGSGEPSTVEQAELANRLAAAVVWSAKACYRNEGGEPAGIMAAHHQLMADVAALYKFETTGEMGTEVADCGCPVTRKQAVITTHTRECSAAQHVASLRAHLDDEYGPDSGEDDDELSTLEVGHITPQFLADAAVVESHSGVPNIDLPLDEDAEPADINARVADDERVFTAVGAAVAEIRGLRHITPAARELMLAWEARAARRALDSGEGQQLAVKHECGEVGNAMGGYNCTCGEPWIDAYGGCVNAPEGQKAAIRAAWKTSQERRAQMLAGGEGQEAS